MSKIIENIILGISIAAPLGPSTIAIIKNGLKHGFRSAITTAAGVVSADTTYVLIVFFGVSYFIAIPIVKTIVWFLGTGVLLYLGYRSIKEAFGKIDLNQAEIKIKPGQNFFIAGYLINISNPLAIVWWLGVFGSILASSTQDVSRLIALLQSLAIVVGIVLWHSSLSLLTHFGKKLLNENTLRYVSVIGGIFMIYFGLRFGDNALISLSGV